MINLNITIVLLFVISSIIAIFLIWAYLEYERTAHLNRIKDMISFNEGEELELLEAKKSTELKSIAHKIQNIINLAGFNMNVVSFVTMTSAFLIFVSVLFVLFLKHWTGVLFGMPLGALLFYMIINAIILKRKKEFNRSLAIAISVLVKMMKNGVGFEQSMIKSIDVSSSKNFKLLFNKFFQEKNTIGEAEAFANMQNYVNSKELRIFALAVKIGRASGGRFSSTLEKVETTIKYRKKMQEKVDVVTREGSVGSYIVAGIAVFLYFSLNANFDGKLHEYYMTAEYGRFQLLSIFLWIFLGLLANKFITRVDK